MQRILSIAVLFALAWGSPATGQAKLPDTRAEVRAFVRELVKLMNEGDVGAVVELYARIPELASITDGEIARGWEAIRADADSVLGMQGTYRVDVGSVDVISLGPSHAVAFAAATITLVGEEGPVQARGAFTFVVRKTPGGWRILHEHSSLQGI